MFEGGPGAAGRAPGSERLTWEAFKQTMYGGSSLPCVARFVAAVPRRFLCCWDDVYHPEATSRRSCFGRRNATLIERWKSRASRRRETAIERFLAAHTRAEWSAWTSSYRNGGEAGLDFSESGGARTGLPGCVFVAFEQGGPHAKQIRRS